ncbi:arsenic-transporting ATPase [filamentous cyanobacterium CCP5]|nr:arsenic-transporting ATPase [filamentous cyanobacterium CCP5]
MALILTFLGKGGSGRTTLAIATAKQLARSGQRVLLALHDPGPAPALLLGHELSLEPSPIEPQLWAMQFQSAPLLEQGWQEIKALEAQYLRTPLLKAVYAQELGVLPGMDSALALNALRQYDGSGDYDAIVYDGPGDLQTLRMLGMPEILDWYARRFQAVFQQSDLYKAISPFLQPLSAAVLAVDWSNSLMDQSTGQVRNILEQGREAVHDPNRVAAMLVTTPEPAAIATARYLWGSAQQVGLTVGGVLVTQGDASSLEASQFAPLAVNGVPAVANGDWQPVVNALPDVKSLALAAPRSVEIDVAAGTVRLFLPSFDKQQVKLSQSGPEVTIDAGDQRRNLFLPQTLAGRPVQGAKFQDQYLTISFG